MYKHNFIVVIKHNGKVLREIDGEVRLPFGSQYTVLLKNKDSRSALVDIEVDGENVLSGNGLIVYGNTSQEIKGFMRDMSVTNRFKFIHKTKEISDYRGDRVDDGLVTVKYRFEREKKEPVTVIRKQNPWCAPDNYPCSELWTYTDIKYGCSPNTNYSSDASLMADTTTTKSLVTDMYVQEPLLNDGITVKGSEINQPYQYGDIGELENRSYIITIQLKGETKRKNIVKKSLTIKTKLRCTTCGRLSKSTSKFCYNCGTYLERF